MTCKYCDSKNLETRERHQRSSVMYSHVRCNDCGKVFFLTDSRKTAWCGSQEEHWKQLAQ
jgi:ribosomal protein L37E